MGRRKNEQGKRYGRFLVFTKAISKGSAESWWWCLCDCGSLKKVRGRSLRNGDSKSCGCLQVDSRKAQVGENAIRYKGGYKNLGSLAYFGYKRTSSRRSARRLGHKPLETSAASLKKAFDESDKTCEICGSDFLKKKGDMCLDHDHQTGVFRGFLCQKCNRGLGHFDDSLCLLETAVSYLQLRGALC